MDIESVDHIVGNHSNTGLAVGEDFPPRIGWHMLIDDVHDTAFFKISRQNRGKPDRFCSDMMDGFFGHKCDFRNVWKSLTISTRKNLGVFWVITACYDSLGYEFCIFSLIFTEYRRFLTIS